MTANRLIYFIIVAFVAGILVLVFIKYTSDKGITRLIDDNEKLLNEFEVNNRLEELKTDMLLVESKIKGSIAANDTTYLEGVETLMARIEADLDKLQKINGDDSTEAYVHQLDYLVRERLRINSQVPDAYLLTDSILALSGKISRYRQHALSRVNTDIDNSVRKMRRRDSFLIIFVLISAAVLFWYILNTIRNQGRLIQQVKDSEKKVKEIAQVKENFLANMSHEIRTPLNAILGFTNLLQQKKLDSESSQYVQTIQRSGESLLTIINDILDLSKIEAGMMRIEQVPFSLRGLMHSVEAMFRAKADEKGIRFFTNIDDSLPDTLEGDATKLTQVLMNLIGNAIKFTARGTIAITIGKEGSEGDIVRVKIEVSDTGIGIPKEKLDRVFDRFHQADEALTREYGGTGLGLSIVKELVELQGGSIRAESETGKGTIFYLVIPYKISVEQVPSHRPVGKESVEPVHLGNARILVAEDNEANQILVQHLFRNWGVDFDMVENGMEAIDKLKTTSYDLILMDIQMPRLDGYAASRQIRNDLKINTPIIAMTAHAMAGEKEKCLSYGMDEYISKPIREQQLRELIAQFVPIEKTSPPKAATAATPGNLPYRYIDLAYMKEVSAGNKEYESLVTAQFINGITQELEALEKAMQTRDRMAVRQIAHNMRTTISVMGLTEILEPQLDTLEYGDAEENILVKNIQHITQICNNALPEARDFLSTLHQ